MAPMSKQQSSNDFNPGDLTKKSDEHDKILAELNSRVGTNENFGKTFSESAKDSKSLELAIKEIVINLLETNDKTKDAVSTIVEKLDKRQWQQQLWGLGKIMLWIVSIVIAALVGAYINSRFR